MMLYLYLPMPKRYCCTKVTLLSRVREASLMFSASHVFTWSGHDNSLTFSLTQYPVSPGTATHPSLLAGSEIIKTSNRSSFSEHDVPIQIGMQAIIHCKLKCMLWTNTHLNNPPPYIYLVCDYKHTKSTYDLSFFAFIRIF